MLANEQANTVTHSPHRSPLCPYLFYLTQFTMFVVDLKMYKVIYLVLVAGMTATLVNKRVHAK